MDSFPYVPVAGLFLGLALFATWWAGAWPRFGRGSNATPPVARDEGDVAEAAGSSALALQANLIVHLFEARIAIQGTLPVDEDWRWLRKMIVPLERDLIIRCGPEITDACRVTAQLLQRYVEAPCEEDPSEEWWVALRANLAQLDSLADAEGLVGADMSACSIVPFLLLYPRLAVVERVQHLQGLTFEIERFSDRVRSFVGFETEGEDEVSPAMFRREASGRQ